MTLGAYLIAITSLVFFYQHHLQRRHKSRTGRTGPGPDPWDARSLEWMTPSPPPEHNFDDDPDRDPRSTTSGTASTARTSRAGSCASPTTEEVAQKGDATRVHLPSPSYWPIALAAVCR